MTAFDHQYAEVLNDILDNGFTKGDRTGTGTLSTFGQFIRIDIKDGKLPLLTTKKIFFRSFIHEMLWFISGSTDIQYLKDNDVSIWDSWVNPKTARYTSLTDDERRKALVKAGVFVTENDVPDAEDIQESLMAVNDLPIRKLVGGDIGNGAYGAMWRKMEDTRLVHEDKVIEHINKGFVLKGYVGEEQSRKAVVSRYLDQLAEMVRKLKVDPDNRRNITHLYDSRMVDFCQLAPCHSFHIAWTRKLSVDERVLEARKRNIEIEHLPLSDEAFSYQLDQLGVPERALRLMMIQRSVDTPVGLPFNIAQYSLLAHMLAHVTNMVAEEFVWVGCDTHAYKDQIELVKEQLKRTPYDNQACVQFNRKVESIDDFTFDDISVVGYDEYHPAIKYPVAV